MIELDSVTLALLTGPLVPLLVALLTKEGAPSWLKATVNVVLSFAAGALAYLQQHGASTWQLVLNAGLAYLASGVSYQNFWKPTQLAGRVQALTGNVGLGGRARRTR